ncbi:MAG: histidinol-phosphatase HisJ family protein [Oscillospiraceae bacterium]|nr:histidinol-phosphatase HisJ family protein [Oscillospiraceae bacterium]
MAAMRFDMHTHTLYSFDCETPLKKVVSSAVRAGLSGVAITDHCDFGAEERPDREEKTLASIKEAKEQSERMLGKLYVGVGLELGQPLHDVERADKFIDSLDVDIVLGALHNTRYGADFYELRKDPDVILDDAFTHYFQEVLDMVKWGRFDVLAHLTYPYRYEYVSKIDDVPPIYKYTDILREIFTHMAHKGIALEVNVSGPCRYGEGSLVMPSLQELKLYRECGGEFVTIGSDAHEARHVGGAIDLGMELALAAGIEWQAVFKKRHPTLLPLR